MGFIAHLLSLVITVLIYIIIIDAILSWTDLYRRNYSLLFIKRTADTLNDPIRRIIPAVNGLDFSPLLTLAILNLLRWLI